MIEQLKYTNHMNETLEFGNGKLFVNENDLHDFVWEVKSKNNRISGFKKGIVSKTIPIILKCDSEIEGVKLRNKLFEVFEKDVLAVKHGRLIIGDYYLKCYVAESKKSEYLLSNGYMKIDAKITTDMPYWTKETILTFGFGGGAMGTNLDFNRDFPSDYTSNLLSERLNNTSFAESNFIMRIYGSCVNPSVVIAGHEYNVAVSVETNEYLTINSVDKTIVLTKADGTKENCFNLRNRDSYVFKKIPSGINTVLNGSFVFDVTLLDERSEPKWI